jgi:hypothetical protein
VHWVPLVILTNTTDSVELTAPDRAGSSRGYYRARLEQ